MMMQETMKGMQWMVSTRSKGVEDETVLKTSCSYGNFISFETRMVNLFIPTFGGMTVPSNMSFQLQLAYFASQRRLRLVQYCCFWSSRLQNPSPKLMWREEPSTGISKFDGLGFNPQPCNDTLKSLSSKNSAVFLVMWTRKKWRNINANVRSYEDYSYTIQ